LSRRPPGNRTFVIRTSLIAARAKGATSTDEEPTHVDSPATPAPEHASNAARKGGGANPLVVIGAAFALGLVLAHVVDWLGQRYPRSRY
jgi:hypothetical protein